MEAVGVVVGVAEGAIFAGKAVGTAIEIYDLDFDPYKEIIKRVGNDVKYSEYCREAMPPSYYEHPELDAWVHDTIAQARDALDKFEKSFPPTPEGREKPKVIERAKHVLIPVGECIEREKTLRCCHSSLLAAMTVMHQHGLVPRLEVAKKRPKTFGLPPSAMPRRPAPGFGF